MVSGIIHAGRRREGSCGHRNDDETSQHNRIQPPPPARAGSARQATCRRKPRQCLSPAPRLPPPAAPRCASGLLPLVWTAGRRGLRPQLPGRLHEVDRIKHPPRVRQIGQEDRGPLRPKLPRRVPQLLEGERPRREPDRHRPGRHRRLDVVWRVPEVHDPRRALELLCLHLTAPAAKRNGNRRGETLSRAAAFIPHSSREGQGKGWLPARSSGAPPSAPPL